MLHFRMERAVKKWPHLGPQMATMESAHLNLEVQGTDTSPAHMELKCVCEQPLDRSFGDRVRQIRVWGSRISKLL